MSLFNFLKPSAKGVSSQGVSPERREQILDQLENAKTEGELDSILKALSPEETSSVAEAIAPGALTSGVGVFGAGDAGASPLSGGSPMVKGSESGGEADDDEGEGGEGGEGDEHEFDSFGADFDPDSFDEDEAPKPPKGGAPIAKGGAGAVDATTFLLGMNARLDEAAHNAQIAVQGNSELAQGLHIALDLVKSLHAETQKMAEEARAERLVLQKLIEEQAATNGNITKALVDVEENALFIKGLRQAPVGHSIGNRGNLIKAANTGGASSGAAVGESLPAGGVAQRPLMGAESLSGHYANESTGADTEAARFGLSERNLMKGLRSMNEDQLKGAGLSLDQFYAIQNGGIPFTEIPKSAFDAAAQKLGLLLQDA